MGGASLFTSEKRGQMSVLEKSRDHMSQLDRLLRKRGGSRARCLTSDSREKIRIRHASIGTLDLIPTRRLVIALKERKGEGWS